MNRQRDRFPRASMPQADVRGEHTMREARQRLFGVIRVDRRHAPQVPGFEGLKQVKRLRTTPLPDENPVWTVAERRPDQVSDGYGRHRLLLAKRRLSAAGLEANEIRLFDENLG